jgi:hypothetical protein
MSGRYSFLPNVRTAVVDAASAPSASSGRRQLALRIQVVANGAAVPESEVSLPGVELKGAGDVIALDLAQIGAREPKPGSAGVEPNYFPYVELVDSDMPWRLSLDVAPGPRRRPWLVLIALTAGEFTDIDPRPGPLPAIRVASSAASLPPLQQSWAWAHVHVQHDAGQGFDLHRALRERPETHVARILCPRRLSNGTAYTLFLVPAFEAGRLRGLGQPASANPWDAPAWDSGSNAALDLPWFDRWSITTSSLEDIESLIRRLKATPAVGPDAPGLTRRIDASQPGYPPGFNDPGRTFEAEGALCAVGFESRRAQFADTPLTPPLVARLNAALTDEHVHVDGPNEPDPLVALPAWGAVHAGATVVASPAGTPPAGVAWVNETNLDLRYRLAAGAGARVVRRHQEDFARQAWEQAGQLLEANRFRARLELAERLTGRLVERHWQALEPAVALSLSEPIRQIANADGTGTLHDRLTRAGLPSGYASLPLRRVAARRAIRPGTTSRPLTAVMPNMVSTAAISATPSTGPRDRVGLARTEIVSDWRHRVFPTLTVGTRNALAPQAGPPGVRVGIGTVDLQEAHASVAQTLRALPRKRARAEILGLTSEESTNLEPVRRGPRLIEPLSTFLAHEQPDIFLPGASAVPYDSITVLEENPRFVESFLAGANEELRRELVYREYPFDQRASAFTRFWDRGADAATTGNDDVPPLDQWNAVLGKNSGSVEPRLVILVRGELARRFPGFMVALNRQTIGSGGWSASAGTTLDPLFWGSIGDDIRLFGFSISVSEVRNHAGEYFLIVYEPPGRLRFGLDIQTWARRRNRRSFTRAPLPFALQTTSTHRLRGLEGTLAGISLTAADPAPSTTGPDTWNDLSWDHVQLTSSGYVDFDTQLSIASDPADGAWGPQRTSASLARTLYQHPVRAVLSARKFFS